MRIVHLQPHDQTTPDDPRTIAADHAISWITFVGGPVLWLLQFLLNSALLRVAATTGRWPLVLCNGVFLVLAAVCGMYAFAIWRRKDPPHAANYQRARFMGQVGLLTSGLFVLLILAQAVPIFIFNPTET